MIQNPVIDFIEQKLAQPADQSYEHAGQKDLAKGLIAGLIAGVAATAVKSVAERIYPPRTHGEPEPPEVLADQITQKVAGHALTGPSKTVAAESIHWGFGAAAGAAYGVLAEFYPAATGRDGANFGMTLMAITHEGALPALGLSAEPADQTNREKSSEMVTHVLFGVVTETVRRFVRARL
jgi:putative membrane protein